MNQQGIFKKWLWAGVMGILTILLCLIVSDDLLGLNSPPARSQIGHYVFWVSLIGLPLLFYKFVSWRYTLLNIPLYFLPFKLMVAGQIACPNYHDIFRKELSV
jgi:hypothetical protein